MSRIDRPIPQDPASCIPSDPMPHCGRCARLSEGLPADPDRRRHTVVIDASLIAERGVCPMFKYGLVPDQTERDLARGRAIAARLSAAVWGIRA